MRAALSVVLVVAAACRGGAATRDAQPSGGGRERSIQDGLAAQLHVGVAAVRCDGARCTATLAGGGDLPIVIAGAGSAATWSIDGAAIAAGPLEQYLAAVLGDLGIAGKVDCGARVRVVHVGDRVECALGDAGRAWARITDGDGDFAIELALGADAVAARSAPEDTASLDRASSALDRDRQGEGGDDPDGDDGAGDGDGRDAGAPPTGGATGASGDGGAPASAGGAGAASSTGAKGAASTHGAKHGGRRRRKGR